jgi:hypothetical protein
MILNAVSLYSSKQKEEDLQFFPLFYVLSLSTPTTTATTHFYYNLYNRLLLLLIFIRYDLLVGVTRAESYFVFNSDDVQYGIEADRRSKILRTYVRSTYSYHLNEILATIVNEYTDWERPVQHPISIR